MKKKNTIENYSIEQSRMRVSVWIHNDSFEGGCEYICADNWKKLEEEVINFVTEKELFKDSIFFQLMNFLRFATEQYDQSRIKNTK